MRQQFKYCVIIRTYLRLNNMTYKARGRRNRRIKFYCELIRKPITMYL